MTIDATGRARVLSRLADKSVARKEPKPRFVGFKAHFRGVEMSPGVCEIYAFRGGYAGLTFVENGEANLCFLAKASTLGGRNNPDIVFSELKKQNIRRADNTDDGQTTSCLVGGIGSGFWPESFSQTDGLFTVGDSAAFVDPFTGSGMLLAMESAASLADCIAECGIDTAAVRSRYLEVFQTRFSPRLKVSGLIRHIAYNPLLSRAAVIALSLSARYREALARRTRSAKLSEGL